MGLTFAKSLRFGPLRFNISGSGIGISGGIPGLRIGVGPRGAYVAGGKAGFRYRKSLGANRSAQRQPSNASQTYPAADARPSAQDLQLHSVEHDTRSVLEFADANADDLVRSMNEQRAKTDLWPAAACVLGLGYFVVVAKTGPWPTWLHVFVIAVAAAATYYVRWRDRVRKLTVLFFDLDDEEKNWFEPFTAAFHTASQVARLRSIVLTAQLGDRRYTSGASQGVKLAAANIHIGQAPGVLANVDVPILESGKTSLAFFPDRVLAFQGKTVGAIAYSDLGFVSESTKFVEQEQVPSDAKVVDHTWQYVNKNGTPDKRFKDNRQYPVCLYSQLNVSTPAGLDLQFLASRDRAFDAVQSAVTALKSRLATH
jgi:hypothetical protein